MRLLLVLALVACSSPAHPKPPAPDPRWRADLQCREQPDCEGNGSECNVILGAAPIQPVACASFMTPAQRERAERDRDAQIAAHTWPCACDCGGQPTMERLNPCWKYKAVTER